jgi:hypothetical protein
MIDSTDLSVKTRQLQMPPADAGDGRVQRLVDRPFGIRIELTPEA